MSTEAGWYSVTEAARYIHESRSTVYKLVEVGRIGHHRRGARGGGIRFTQAQLDAYLASTRVDPSGLGQEPAPVPRPVRKVARPKDPLSPEIPDPTGLRARARRARQT